MAGKTLALVTCLYDLVKRGSAQHRTVDWMLANNDYVLSLDRELVIFTERELEADLIERRRGRPTKVFSVPFEELLGEERAAACARGDLQGNASKWKVTPTYVQLMWAKYAMLETALALTRTSHLGWIDLGISHVGKLPTDGRDIFADPSDRPRVHVLRCFSKRDVDHPDYWRNVQGHLAGGLVVGRRDQMHSLVADFWRAVDRAIAMGLAPLDEGLLSYVVGQRPADFSYSYGDYEDILRNHDGPRHGEAHRRWITEDARARGLSDNMAFANYRTFRPAFSPRSCYLLRDADEEAYFAAHGGAPEAALIGWATQFIGKDQVFVDVGAHVGSWAQHLAQACAEVHAFEPQRSTYERLREGVRIAEIDNVVSHDAALGARGEVYLHVVSSDGGGSTVRHRSELGAVKAVERVRAAQLDDFDLRNVGLVKIDAEGLEIDILRGAAKLLEEQRPTLLLEAWDHDWYAAERAELIAYVRSIGYDVTPISGWPQMLLVEPVQRSPRSVEQEPEERKPPQMTQPTEPNQAQAPSTEQMAAANALLQSIAVNAQAGPDRPLLGLVMIVKNEAKRIGMVLQSYRAHIDSWTILDTGSTDGTQDLIRKELDGVPGSLYEEPFVDFATSRNRALELHGLSTVFSIMPNGDVLSGGPELRTFLEAHRRDFATGAYRVRISPGHYYHPLVMRTGMGWRYKWRTHECAMGPNVGAQIEGVTVHRDRGARSDAEWRARWSRDLDLLNRDLTEDPNDPRPYFYLGQTHECLGQFAQALAFFEKRATMGGYFDEVYEAKFRVAKMKEKLGRPWAEIQQSYLEAFAHDPRRAEPLFAISEHWYDKVHAISRIFSIAAAEMEKPPTDLFLDESVYTWKAADRAAISSFYSGHKDSGRYWADEAVAASPRDERLRANRAFFSQSAAELFGASVKAIEFTPEPGWNASNPSIFADGDHVRCVVRTVNYRIVNGRYVTPPDDLVRDEGTYKGWQLIRTRNFLLDLDADLKTTRTIELVDATGVARTSYPVHGFEDARLFAWKGSWWATCTVCDFTEDGAREIALLKIDDDGAVVRADALRGPWSDQQQKNWMPFVEGDVLRFIYATYPTTTFELTHADDGAPKILHAPNASLGHGRLRGGSQGVRVDGGWIFIVHDVAFPPGGGRLYLHRFVLLDDKLQLVSMTDPFYFEQLGIEFCAGLAQVGDKLVASYAVNDGSARLGIFDWRAVRRTLRKDFVI